MPLEGFSTCRSLGRPLLRGRRETIVDHVLGVCAGLLHDSVPMIDPIADLQIVDDAEEVTSGPSTSESEPAPGLDADPEERSTQHFCGTTCEICQCDYDDSDEVTIVVPVSSSF